jgi:hypothetical protein
MLPVASLVHQHLRDSDVLRAPIHPAQLHAVASRIGIGLDHLAGELPLALLSATMPAPYVIDYLVTDRRVIGRAWASDVADTIVDFPLAWVRDVRKTGGLLSRRLDVTIGEHSAKIAGFVDHLEPFLRACLHLPPEARAAAPLPFAPSAGDETGAMSASHAVLSGDPRVAILVRAIAGAHRQGWCDAATGWDLVARTILLDRTIANGRGMRGGWWSTLAPRPIVAALLPAIFGEPSAHLAEGPTEGWDFPISTQRSSNVAANVVGLALFAAVGVGFYRRSAGGPNLQGIRILLADAPPYGGVSLLGFQGNAWQPLSKAAPSLVAALHQTLLELDARVLATQVAFGPSCPPESLLAQSPEQLADRLGQALGGPVDVSPFYPRA